MSEINFKTTKQLADEYGISEVTQWRDRYPKGPLEFYRISGKIRYSTEQLQKYFEAKRVGSGKTSPKAVPA
jgi:hypothetical protein